MRALAILLLLCGVAYAHKPSDAHLRLAIDGRHLAGQISVAVRDLDGALDVDADGNGDITWAETRAASPRVAKYLTERLQLDSGGACTVAIGVPGLVDLTDGAYWTAPVDADCPSAPGSLAITYKLLFDIDAQHRGIVHLSAPGFAQTIVIKTPQPVTAEVTNPTAAMAVISSGGRAIALATLLVLALLLLPARRKAKLVDDAALAGTFALAQVATFLLVASGSLELPASWVAPVIALTVTVLAAANVLGFGRHRGALAVELGLVHGFALAFAFALPSRSLAVLLAFGAGAVLAQVALGTLLAAALAWLRTRQPARAIAIYPSIAAAVAGVLLAVL